MKEKKKKKTTKIEQKKMFLYVTFNVISLEIKYCFRKEKT